MTVFDRETVREIWVENDDGDRVPLEPVPDWVALREPWSVMQYVICDGEGGILAVDVCEGGSVGSA